MKIDLIELQKDIEDGWINFQTSVIHPELRIFKYSPKTAYSKEWTDLRRKCRGLVTSGDGEVIVNSMPKFFNHSEREGIEILERNKGQRYIVSTKEDGSLIQVAIFKDRLIVTSSGSFDSPQARKAIEIIKKSSNKYGIWIKSFQEGFTYIFEIIYPENRIVLNYGDRESLILLAVRKTDTGEEQNLMNWYFHFPIVNGELTTIDALEAETEEREDFINLEGYVVKFENGDRVKFKYNEYIKLHKIISNLSEKSIWESLKDGGDPEKDLAETPDELFDFVEQTCKALKGRYKDIEALIPAAMKEINKLETRKEKAKLIMDSYKYIRAVLFSALDNKDYSKEIWKMIEPETNGKIMGRGENI